MSQLQRPDVPAMDEIEAMIQDIADLEQARKNLKALLLEMPGKMARQLTTEEEKLEAAGYLYWHVPELNVDSIASGFFGPGSYNLAHRISTIDSGLCCEGCGAPMQATSRTNLKGQRKGVAFTLECPECRKKRYAQSEEYRAEWIDQRAREAFELSLLKSMPYKEYLQTPHWQERRRRHLKSARFRCQVCNASGVRLNVHHRTYERRGEESYADLLALCEDCHGIFHREGKLKTNQ